MDFEDERQSQHLAERPMSKEYQKYLDMSHPKLVKLGFDWKSVKYVIRRVLGV